MKRLFMERHSGKIIVLHESGAKSHYRALIDDKNLCLKFYEFAFLKLMAKSIMRKDLGIFKKQILNLIFLLKLPFLRNKTLILGIAPFDYRILFFGRVIKKNEVIYHSSWPEWNSENYPKRFLASFVRGYWKKFLVNCKGVACVSSETKKQIQLFCGVGHERIWIVNHSLSREFTGMEVRNRRESACLFVGRIEDGKGLDRVFQLAQLLPEMKFYLAGEIRGNIKIPSFPNIFYVGYLKSLRELADLYDKSTFLLLPSKKTKTWQELFGLVVIEAMYRGCVPLCTNHVGPNEILGAEFPNLLFSEDLYVRDANIFIKNILSGSHQFIELSDRLIKSAKQYESENIRRLWKL